MFDDADKVSPITSRTCWSGWLHSKRRCLLSLLKAVVLINSFMYLQRQFLLFYVLTVAQYVYILSWTTYFGELLGARHPYWNFQKWVWWRIHFDMTSVSFSILILVGIPLIIYNSSRSDIANLLKGPTVPFAKVQYRSTIPNILCYHVN